MNADQKAIEGRRGVVPRHHAPFAIVYVGLIEDPKHAEALGLRGMRMFLRILAAQDNETGEVALSVRWLARSLGMHHRDAEKIFRERLLGTYLEETDRKVGHWRVYRVRRPFYGGGKWRPQSRQISGGDSPPDSGQVAANSRQSEVAALCAPTGGESPPELAAKSRHTQRRPNQTAAARAQARTREAAAAVAAAGPDPEAAPAATTEPPACPVPEDLLEEWAEWAYPTAPDPLGELRADAATIRRLTELWERVPRPSAWRAAMRAKPRSEVKVPIALFPRLLDQCAGEGDSTRSDATRSESERLRQASLDARRERLAEIAGWIWTRGARLDRRQAERLGIGDLAIADDGTQAAVLGWVESRGLEVVTTSGPRILTVAELAHWCAAEAARTGAPQQKTEAPTSQPRSRLGSAGAAWLQRRNGAPDRSASSDGAGSTIDPGAEMARALERELA